MKDHENKIDFGCSGKIGETHSTLVGSAVINGSFNGFSSIEMTIVSENNDLSSSWSFEEKNSFMPKISK